MTELSRDALYQSVESALRLMDCDIGPAECHGILCGMLCGVQQFDPSAWLEHTTGYHGELNLTDLGSGHALEQLLSETLAGFSADDFSLHVLLPEDEYSLATRTEALGSWCRGFLSGFGLGEPAGIEQLSEDSRGFLRDLEEIGKVDVAEADDDDDGDDEYALMEICEYTRMGALLLREETQFMSQTERGDGTVH